MAFFKTKAEKEIIAQMQRDEQMQIFNDQINELKQKRQEYANIAAEAEVNGDQGSYDVALSALMELNDVISTSGMWQCAAVSFVNKTSIPSFVEFSFAPAIIPNWSRAIKTISLFIL